MIPEKRPLWQRALQLGGFLLLSAAWLFLAVVLWDGGRLAWGGKAIYPKVGVLPVFRNLPSDAFLADLPGRFSDSMGLSALSIYLVLCPLPCWAFTLAVLLPDGLRRLFPTRKKLLWGYGLAAALAIAFGLLCALAGCTSLLRRPLGISAEQRLARIHMFLILLSALLAVLGWLLPCAVLRLRELIRERALLREARGSLERFLLCALLAFAVTAASCLLLAALRPLAPQAVRYVENFCAGNAAYGSMFFVSVVMAPIMEELTFRGLIQRGLRRSLPAWAAVGITALFFGVWHRNTGQFVYTFCFGLAVGTVCERTGELRCPWLIHALNNLFAVMGYSDRSNSLLGQLHVMPWLRRLLIGLRPWAAIPLLLLFLAGIVLLLRLFRAKTAARRG